MRRACTGCRDLLVCRCFSPVASPQMIGPYQMRRRLGAPSSQERLRAALRTAQTLLKSQGERRVPKRARSPSWRGAVPSCAASCSSLRWLSHRLPMATCLPAQTARGRFRDRRQLRVLWRSAHPRSDSSAAVSRNAKWGAVRARRRRRQRHRLGGERVRQPGLGLAAKLAERVIHVGAPHTALDTLRVWWMWLLTAPYIVFCTSLI